MEKLIFSLAISQSGFTNASILASNDKDSSTIIREILQNSYDSAINEANRDKAKVKFIIDYIDKSDIPGIIEYEKSIESINLIETLSKQENKRSSTTTKKIPKKPKVTSESDTPTEAGGEGKKDKSATKQKTGSPFEIGIFSSFHNVKKQEAKLRFATDKNASNLLLVLNMNDGTDPTYDSFGITPRLKINKVLDNDIECKIIHNDTIDIRRVA